MGNKKYIYLTIYYFKVSLGKERILIRLIIYLFIKLLLGILLGQKLIEKGLC